jgi:hypothetical protein
VQSYRSQQAAQRLRERVGQTAERRFYGDRRGT